MAQESEVVESVRQIAKEEFDNTHLPKDTDAAYAWYVWKRAYDTAAVNIERLQKAVNNNM